MSAIGAAIVRAVKPSPHWSTLAAGTLAAALLAIYLLYFKAANARLAAGRLSSGELAAELALWARWHWLRVAVGVAAFGASLPGLRNLP